MAGSPKPRGTKKKAGSLLSAEAMGGINAGKGFDFQTRYTVCRLPAWLLEAAFHRVIERHDTLRTSFAGEEGGLVQRIPVTSMFVTRTPTGSSVFTSRSKTTKLHLQNSRK